MRLLIDRRPHGLASTDSPPDTIAEFIGGPAHPSMAVKLAAGGYRVGDAQAPRLGPLLARLPAVDRPIKIAEAECAHRFDVAAARVATHPEEAFELARDATIELHALAEQRLGHGACPATRGVDFDGVARLIRRGEPTLGLVLAVASLEHLGARLDRPLPLPPWRRAPDPLDGWFDTDPGALDAALAILRSEQPPPALSTGNTFRQVTHELVPGGPQCEVIFGSLWRARCHCGSTTAPGVRCPDCGVVTDTQARRDAQFGRIDLPIGVLHPARFAAAADRLGVDVDAVRRLAQGEQVVVAGAPTTIGALLTTDPGPLAEVLVHRVPVTPPGDRPRTLAPAADGSAVLEHPLDDAIRILHHRAARVQRMRRMRAPAMLLHPDVTELQAVVVAYHEKVSAPPIRISGPRAVRCGPGATNDPPPAAIHALLWTGPGVLLAQRSTALTTIAVDEARIANQVIGDARTPRYSHHGALGCLSPAARWSDERLDGAGVRGLADGAWLDRWPAHMPCAVRAPDGTLVYPTIEHREPLWAGDGSPRIHAWQHDGRVIWVGDDGPHGALVWLDDHRARTVRAWERAPVRTPVLQSRWADTRLELDGELTPVSGRLLPVHGPGAVHVGRATALLQPNGVFSNDGGGRWQLGFAWTAAGFEPGARRLAVATPDATIIVIDVAGPTIVGRIPL